MSAVNHRHARAHLANGTRATLQFGAAAVIVVRFTGNTMWDWIKLLLLPLLVPTVLIPVLTSRLADRFEPTDRE